MTKYLAHKRERDNTEQSLEEHLQGVASLSRKFANKLSIGEAGELIGLLHDLGKYSKKFQQYLKNATGNIDPDADEYMDVKAHKGKIDHSTAGAQLIWNTLIPKGADLSSIAIQRQATIAQILSLCIASHHSGLIDCLESKPQQPVHDRFSKRMRKLEKDAHLAEVTENMDKSIRKSAQALLVDSQLLHSIASKLGEINRFNKQKKIPELFKQGLLIRFLFSCLIDADRTDTADFENPVAATKRQHGRYQNFPVLIERLEAKLATFKANSDVNKIRRDISGACLARANDKQGIFTLSVPTGGGKTLASLRFALNHAEKHALERIIYVIPFTSIIDQNADETRKILEPEDSNDHGKIVLEHHSNLTPQEQSWKNKILSENWDAPIVYTTMVQFLETVFGSGTRGARRMHQLSKAVIVFDEIQTLPVNCVHLFNNAIQFLVDHCDSTAVLCTATQPLLHKVDPTKGSLTLSKANELMEGNNLSVAKLFHKLQRVDIIDQQRENGYSFNEIAGLAATELETLGSCLIIVNTKNAAREIFQASKTHVPNNTFIFHLSTSMCPAHRKKALRVIRKSLATKRPVLCVSSQLIEAGVDVSFGAVIRLKAGLDSIAQAAGRCNRHGEMQHTNGKPRKGRVSIVNLPEKDEQLGMVPDIAIGQAVTERVLRDFNQTNLLSPDAMERYFHYYFFERKDEMSYPIKDKDGNDNILNLLSENAALLNNYQRAHSGRSPQSAFKQSFMTAAKAFKAIDAPTRGIIVPYGKRGQEIINKLCSAYEPDKQYALLREAQQYTVNVFPNMLAKLIEADVLHNVQEDIDILYLKKPEYYSNNFGLSNEVVGEINLTHFM